MWKKNLISMVGMALVALTACQATPTPPARITRLNLRPENKLIIATNQDYPPYSAQIPNATRPANTLCTPQQLTADEIGGFDVAVSVAVAERLGLEPCFIFGEWERMTDGYWDGDWDMAVASISITPQRMENLWFVQPYSAVPAQFFVRQDSPLQQVTDLSGLPIAVCSGCTYEQYLRGNLRLVGQEVVSVVRDPVVLAYNTENDMLNALITQPEVQAALTSPAFGQAGVAAGMPIKPLGAPVFYEYLSIALDKRRPNDTGALALAVHEIIRAMHADGTLRNLALTHLGEDVTERAAQFNPAFLQLPQR